MRWSVWNVGAGIYCYVCNSGYHGDLCEHIPDDGKGREGFKKDCDNLTPDLGRPERNYTLCRKYIQDGKVKFCRTLA